VVAAESRKWNTRQGFEVGIRIDEFVSTRMFRRTKVIYLVLFHHLRTAV
jgi:hypothetical protein